ncbi:hypothetical protein P9112_002408 [Eukaryota sp. TZLM1-RC]
MPHTSYIRRATYAGSWYPGTSSEIALMLASYTNVATNRYPGSKAVIVPHAGYAFSGSTAAYGFNCIDWTMAKTIIVLGPSHRSSFRNVAVSGASELETPLGNLAVDTSLAFELVSKHSSLFDFMSQRVDESEHSLEMQFPFIKFFMSRMHERHHDIKVLPLMVGHMNSDDQLRIGDALRDLANDQHTVFVVSSDFCHFGRRFGFTKVHDKPLPLHKRIEDLDMEAIKAIKTMDHSDWELYLSRTGNTVCGASPISLILIALSQLGYQFHLLHYAQSSEASSVDDASVSYVAGSFHSAFE